MVDFPRKNLVRLKRDGMPVLRRIIMDQWIAISDDTAARIRQDPNHFSVEVRTHRQARKVRASHANPIGLVNQAEQASRADPWRCHRTLLRFPNPVG